jgi:hypothetical protein
MIRIFLALLLLSSAALAMPGQPVFIQVGTLSCAARMYTPIQLQIWCFKDPALKVLQLNQLIDVSDCGFEFQINTNNDVTIGTSLFWKFLPNVSLNPIVVSWQATITKFGVAGTMFSGVL